MIHTWKKSLLSFYDKRILAIFFFGFSSGLPFLLTLSTLSVWLKEAGASNTTIGFFILVTLPYTLKFLWGPLVDEIPLPFFTSRLGRRRSWALVAQSGLVLTLLGLGNSFATQDLLITAAWAFSVAMFSALQDVTVEAYRIEIIDKNQQGSAASAMTVGWQLGIMTSGAGALFLATFFSWGFSYKLMAALMSIGLLTTLLSPLLSASQARAPRPSWRTWMTLTYRDPFRALFHHFPWPLVFAIIFAFKIGDTVLSTMNIPFLVEIGFTKIEIAHTTKLFGISTMILGGIVGGVFLNRFGMFHSLLVAILLQMAASFLFAAQALMGHHLTFLILVVGVENLSVGFGAAAFMVYLSSFCRMPYTATHFALLSSFGSFVRVFISIGAGMVADQISWPLFFLGSALGGLPCIALLCIAFRRPFSFS